MFGFDVYGRKFLTYSFTFLTLQDFVKSCIEDDLADHNLYAKVFNEGYLARVTDANSYLAVTRDVLNRYVTTYLSFPDISHGVIHSEWTVTV